MKITIEPTTNQLERDPDAMLTTVRIEHPLDDLNIWQIAEMLRDALRGLGFAEENISEVFNDYTLTGN